MSVKWNGSPDETIVIKVMVQDADVQHAQQQDMGVNTQETCPN